MAVEGYCVKCKAKQEMQAPEKITMKNGRPATKGTCPKCGTKMFKIGAQLQLYMYINNSLIFQGVIYFMVK